MTCAGTPAPPRKEMVRGHMFSRMLVPLDGSRMAEAVLPIVVRFAELASASVVLLHVIEKDAPVSIHGDFHLTDVATAEEYLSRIAENLKGRGLNVETHVHTVPQGDVPSCIADHSSELDRDLVVLCRHGAGSVRRFVFGSNAERVVMHGETPVLLVHAEESDPDHPFGPSSIVLLLDDSANDTTALDVAAEIARLSGSHLYILSVVPTMQSISAQEASTGRLFPYTTRHVLDIAAEESMDSVREAVDRMVARGVRAIGRVERGETASAVVTLARAVQADLVVLTTRNLAGLSAFWANDVTRKLAGAYAGTLLLLPRRRGRG